MTEPRPSWRWLLTGLSALGFVLSIYLSWHHLLGGSVIGCGGGSPCEQVLSSRWSSIGGLLPVSGLAAGAYLAMLVASFFIGPGTALPDRRLAWGALLVLTGATAGSAVWFIILQKWAVAAICPYCMATHTTSLLLAAVVFWRAPRVAGQLQMICNSVIGLVLAGVLVIAQVVLTPPPVYQAGQSQNGPPAIDPKTVPLVGSPNARYIVTLFSDYECSHCQRVHTMLEEAVRRYKGNLAFVLCPAPLNSHCNPYVGRDLDQFKDSCDLAKLGLAVWRARREAFEAFNHWMFTFDSGDRWHPRTLRDARTKAAELVGPPQLDAALADPWVEQYLHTSIQIYGSTGESGNAVPKLALGERWVIPQPETIDDLLWILHESLAVPEP